MRSWPKPAGADLGFTEILMHRSAVASLPRSLRSAPGWSGYRFSSCASAAQSRTPSASAALPGRTRSGWMLMASGLHKGQVGVIEIATRVHGPDIGVAAEQPGRRTQRRQVAAEVDQRVGAALDFQRLPCRAGRGI